MRFPYVFRDDLLKQDINTYLDKYSTRILSEKCFGKLSPSTISRLATGKKTDVTTEQLLVLCDELKTTPIHYFQKCLL